MLMDISRSTCTFKGKFLVYSCRHSNEMKFDQAIKHHYPTPPRDY